MTRVAAVDCGTNSLRLLIAEVTDEGHRDLIRRMEITRLGQGVDATGRLAPQALERSRGVLAGYGASIRDHQVSAVRVAATSATRDAANRAEFEAIVREAIGVAPEVITGEEEARLSFTGAVSGLADPRPPVLVCDIGGGSTELVVGEREPDGGYRILGAHSMDIGSVRMTERHLRDDPPTPAQIAAAEADIRAALATATARVPARGAGTFVGVAGSITTIAGVALGLPAYDSARIHHSRFEATEVERVAAMLLAADHDTRAAQPTIHPGRVDVIAAGALILRVLMTELQLPRLVVSEHDILDGLAASLYRG